jgi:signal transduction histidine kinase
MATSKHRDHSPEQRRFGPRAVGRAKERADVGTAVFVHDRVLREISHELGNFFHKLYYWSDYLRERPVESGDSTAVQMLERTIRNLEEFLKVSLDYFRPTPLSLVRMKVSDLIEGVLFQVRTHLNGTPVAVDTSSDWEGEAVMVDPGQLSRAFAVAIQHLVKQVGPDTKVRVMFVRSAHEGCAGVEVRIALAEPGTGSPLFGSSKAGVEWALAERLVTLHGGELVERPDEAQQKHLSVFLPLSPS